MSTQNPPKPKTMSSRLMTMKFMQRAAASTSFVSESHSGSLDAPSPKRQKVSGVSASTATSLSDLPPIQAALAEEEEKKGKAIERLAEDEGETDWILSTVNGDGGHGLGGIQVTKAGYSDIDQEAWRPAMVGRRSFGKFNRDLEFTDSLRAQKCQYGVANNSSSSGKVDSETSGEDGEEMDDPASTQELYLASKDNVVRRVSDERHKRQQERRSEKAELLRLADERRSKEVKLNKLSSISGGGMGGSKPGSSRNPNMECYLCGGKGHTKRECPQKRKRRNEFGHSEAVKKTKPLDF